MRARCGQRETPQVRRWACRTKRTRRMRSCERISERASSSFSPPRLTLHLEPAPTKSPNRPTPYDPRPLYPSCPYSPKQSPQAVPSTSPTPHPTSVQNHFQDTPLLHPLLIPQVLRHLLLDLVHLCLDLCLDLLDLGGSQSDGVLDRVLGGFPGGRGRGEGVKRGVGYLWGGVSAGGLGFGRRWEESKEGREELTTTPSAEGAITNPGIEAGLKTRSQSLYPCPAPNPNPRRTGHGRPARAQNPKRLALAHSVEGERGARRKRIALARTPPPMPRPAFTMALERQRSVWRRGRSAGVGSWGGVKGRW